MKITNKYGIEVPVVLFVEYFKKLINDFYKLLPIFEGCDFKTKEIIYTQDQAFKMFKEYLKNFIYELCGGYYLFDNNEYFLTLLTNSEGMKQIQIGEHAQLKSLVMKCINICKKIIKEIERGG